MELIMGGLKGLTKKVITETHADADTSIKGAKVSHNSKQASQVTFQRKNFSLTEAVSDEIDRISLIPRSFRSSRSDVVKAAIELLSKQPDDVINELLKNAKADQIA